MKRARVAIDRWPYLDNMLKTASGTESLLPFNPFGGLGLRSLVEGPCTK